MKYISIFFIVFTLFSCQQPTDSKTGNNITSFIINGQTEDVTINTENATVYSLVDTRVNFEKVMPVIEVSEGATINPASGIETDFSKGVVSYVVTAENNETKNWSVTVEAQKSDEADILSFSVRRQNGVTIIEDTTVTAEVKTGMNLAALNPKIEISAKATINPASGEEVDFSNGFVIYTVSAENGRKQQWLVEVKGEKLYEAKILSYSVPEQVGETIFDGNKLNIEVPVGYDLTSVVPAIEITENTTVSPASGEAVDFSTTGYVDYKVTTEINTSKSWRVYTSEEVIKANHPNIQYMGRVEFIDPLKARLHAAGATVNIKFKGTYCQIILNDEQLWGNTQNYLEISVDGNEPVRIQTKAKANTIDMVKDLADGEHTLSITKDTEAALGFIELVGFRCDELLEPDALPTRRIEFIGNSITCGMGVYDIDVACDAGQWYDQHSAYYAYGPQTARMLNSQWILSSESGIGLIHSCCDKPHLMKDIYETASLSVGGSDWDFSQYQADVVTICLGQNDGVQDSTAFCSAYVEFIETIRSKYTDATIVCLTSPMAEANLYNALDNYLSGVVSHMNENGDAKVHQLNLSYNLQSGCSWHPSWEEHTQIANELSTYLKDLMGW